MKIGILSDIHVTINSFKGNDRVTPSLCSFIKANKLDLFIIAGDIASDYTTTLSTVRTIEQDTGIVCLFVPGNHDIWTEKHPHLTSWDIYHTLQEHSSNLASSPFQVNERWTAIGDLGWYDYRFGNSRYSIEEFNTMRYKDRIWQDSIMAKWDRSTVEMHSFFLDKLEKQLERNTGKNVILVTHVLPIQEFTVQNPPPMWQYLNAFMGSPDYGKLIEKYPNIRYAVSGHVHYRKQIQKGRTTFICNCLGYKTEWQDTNDPAVEIPRAVTIIEI